MAKSRFQKYQKLLVSGVVWLIGLEILKLSRSNELEMNPFKNTEGFFAASFWIFKINLPSLHHVFRKWKRN